LSVAQTLESIGPLRRWLFRKFLSWAQRYGPYREQALFHVGAAWPTLRRLALELGERLAVVGTLNAPDDVFYLNSEEIIDACDARSDGRTSSELGQAARRRRDLRDARKKLHPPGTVPPGSHWKIGPFDLSAWETQKRNAEDSNVLNGFAVSPGRVTGPATVILSPADFADMKPDTILVCPTTTPAWTPLFAQAMGLVTDIGGILAHGSIVAREYGIPAVMGTGNITQRVSTGQRISVDGDTGTVTLLSDST
ncbi:MAG: PEP-utilizing enzyme, partial [Pseudomonadales bacterium]